MKKEELEIIKKLCHQAYCQIGNDFQTSTGFTSAEGLFEVILDSSWMNNLAKTKEEKEALEKFLNLKWDDRLSYVKEIFPHEKYECGKSKYC